MWDEQTANLLSSKHDPFNNKKGEIGMSLSSDDDNDSEDNSFSDPSSISSSGWNKDRAVTTTLTYGMKRQKKKKTMKPKDKLPSSYAGDDNIRGSINAIVEMNDNTTKEVNDLKRPSTSRIWRPVNEQIVRTNGKS